MNPMLVKEKKNAHQTDTYPIYKASKGEMPELERAVTKIKIEKALSTNKGKK